MSPLGLCFDVVARIITPFHRFVCGELAVRIATYNLKNLFLVGEGPAKPGGELRPLMRMIAQVDADVLVVQEVGSHASLAALNTRLEQPYEHIGLQPGNSERSIHVGVLSKFALQLKSHRDLQLQDEQGDALLEYASEAAAARGELSPLKFARDLLRIDVAGLKHPLSIFAVHLKSRTNRPWRALAAETVRAAECRKLVEVFNDYRYAHPDAMLALCGDMNDRLTGDALSPLQTLALHDPVGDILRRSGRNPSTYWPKRRMRIDHILLCELAAPYIDTDSPQIHANRMAQTASDHFPVSVDLLLDEP